MNLCNVEFVKSAASSKDFIPAAIPAIVFAGKSNVGKSSVINRLLNRKNIARTSSKPGKTVHINYFLIDGKAYFVDLPGYGYAQVAMIEKERWSRLMEQFFSDGEHITLGVMIVDCRHAPTGYDKIMSDWFIKSERPFVVVANKCDKLKNSEIESKVEIIKDTLGLTNNTPIIIFSAEKGIGAKELMSYILKYIK